MRPRSLTTTLAIALPVLSVVVLLIANGLQVLSNVTTQQQVIAGKLQLIAQAASQPVSSFIRDKFRVLETAAQSGQPSQPEHQPSSGKFWTVAGQRSGFSSVGGVERPGKTHGQGLPPVPGDVAANPPIFFQMRCSLKSSKGSSISVPFTSTRIPVSR